MIRDDLIDVEFSFDGWVPSEDDKTFGIPFPDELLYDRSEWRDVLEEIKKHDPFTGPHPKGCIVANYGPYVFNQHPESSCFPPGTRVRMSDGSNKPIEDVRLLDEVLTAEGRIGSVTHLFGRDHTQGLLHIKLAGRSDGLKLTAEHPLLVRRPVKKRGGVVWDDKSVSEYVEAKHITPGMFVAMPRYMATGSSVLQTESHLSHRARHYATRESYGQYKIGVGGEIGNQELMLQIKIRVPDLIDLDRKAGRIFGLFLAEGSTNRGRVTWTFSADEEHTLAAELINLLHDAWGAEARVQLRHGSGSCNVHLQGVQWARLFESLFSQKSGAKSKRVHPDLLGAGSSFLSALLYGWLDGDGSKQSDGYWHGVTISHDLALNMYDIAQSLGYKPRLRKSHPKASRGVKSRQPRYDVDFKEESPDQDSRFYSQDETHVWRRVRTVEELEYRGKVYNFEVSGDNSYVAEGYGVHNCVHNSACGCVMRVMNLQAGNENQVVLSPMSGYCRVTRRRHSGSMMWEALELSNEEGHLPSDKHGQADKFEHTFHENTPFVQRERLPSGWPETAKHFRCLEWLRIDSREQFASALLNQFAICYGRSGHCICGEDLVYDSKRRAFYVRSCDSYGLSRDGTGRIYDSERMWGTGGAWACRVATMRD